MPRWNLVGVSAALCSLVWAPLSSAGESLRTETGERWALLIGINEYQAAGRLQFCREDAEALGKVLVERGGFSPERVVVLADGGTKPQDWPTGGNIRRRIDQFATLAGPEDTVFVFFSGHGMMLDGQGYLMAVDSDRDPANNIALSWVKERLEGCKAKQKLLVLDVCHAGSAKDVGGLAPSLAAGAKALAVLASCAANQISYVEEERSRGVFGGRLVEGLGGEADADGDKEITLAELYGFVRQSMTDWCLATGKTQSPALYPEPPPSLVLARVQAGAKRPVQPVRVPLESAPLPLSGKLDGIVTDVNLTAGVVQINLGSDDGVVKGMKFYVYDKAHDKYLATLTIDKVAHDSAAGQLSIIRGRVEKESHVTNRFVE